MEHPAFPVLPSEFEPTRATLHAYARAVAALPRAHAPAHPKWWHASLRVRPEGLVTSPVPLPDGGSLGLHLDLHRHDAVLTSGGEEHRFDLMAGSTAAELGGMILTTAAGMGVGGQVDHARFADHDPRPYDPAAAAAYFEAFASTAAVFEQRRRELGEGVGPVQVWPHGFDLAFEWFGAEVEHDGETVTAQINLGFYPGGEPYVYSSPWPFDPGLLAAALPEDAYWNTEWNGAVLPYAAVCAASDPEERILEFSRAVHSAAAPALGG